MVGLFFLDKNKRREILMPCLAQFFQVWGTMIQTIALVVTLIIIIFYTIFTFQLRKTAIKQTKLQLTPYIILKYKNDLICRNIGNCPAINIEISTFEAINKDSKLVFRIKYPPLYVLEPKEEKIIKPEIKIEDKELEYITQAYDDFDKKFFPFFPKETKVEEYSLVIDYENIENTPFRTEARIKCLEEKIKILSIKEYKKKPENNS